MSTTFHIDISRQFKNKDGYGRGYSFNNSFVTEEHTLESFLKVIRSGFAYTMVHKKRKPKDTGADKRNVKTPKHIENFISRQELTIDDDRGTDSVIWDWLDDPFFSQYGFAFAESSSSKPKEQKGHAIFIFDRPINDPVLYKDCLRAACTYWSRQVDWLVNIDRTIYNGEGQPVHVLGNVCPFEVFEEKILNPWRDEQIKQSKELEEKKKNLPVFVQNGTENLYTAYIEGYLNWIAEHVATKTKGQNRNIAIYWAGRAIGGILATDWAKPYVHLTNDFGSRIIEASRVNGYYNDYAGYDSEILRIYERGIMAGGDTLDHPRVQHELSKIKPALTAEQKAQAAKVIEQLAEEGAWIKFNRLIKEYGIDVGFNSRIVDHFGIGYKPQTVNKETGEIEEPAITVPFYNVDGDVISVEYRRNAQFDYEGNVALYQVRPLLDEETKGVIILPDSFTSINYYLSGTNSFEVYGLPHEVPTSVELPDKERYCIFDRETNLEVLESLDSEDVRFVKVPTVQGLLQNVDKSQIEKIASRGKKLKEVI